MDFRCSLYVSAHTKPCACLVSWLWGLVLFSGDQKRIGGGIRHSAKEIDGLDLRRLLGVLILADGR